MDNNGDYYNNNQSGSGNPDGNFNPQYYQNLSYYNQPQNGGYNLNGQYQGGYNQNGYNPNDYNPNGYYRRTEGMRNTPIALPLGDVVTMSFMFMFVALLITGITALSVAQSGLWLTFFANPGLIIGIFIAEIVVVICAGSAMRHNNAVLSGILFLAYSVINGLTLSVVFLAYDLGTITHVFFLTAAIFGAMAVYGAVTKKDLTSLGSLLFMGLFGIIIATILNAFIFHSEGMDFAIDIIGVLVFVGLTAYDTQKIKKLANDTMGYSVITIGMWGALELYLDFINLFLRLLRIMARANRN